MKRLLIFVIAVALFFIALNAWAIPAFRFRPVSGKDGPVARRQVKHVSLRPQPALRASESMDVPVMPNRLQEWVTLERNMRGPIGAFSSCGTCYGIAGYDLVDYAELQKRMDVKR